MEELKKEVRVLIQRNVLADITLAMYKKREEGLQINWEEMMEIINNLSQEYER